MKISKVVLTILLIGHLTFFLLLSSKECFAKLKTKSKDFIFPICSNVGSIDCPKGFKPTCPVQYKPSCIFVGKKYYPACLADSSDNTFLNYHLDKIKCEKK